MASAPARPAARACPPLQALFDHIPVGVGSQGIIPTTARDLEEALEMGMDWSLREVGGRRLGPGACGWGKMQCAAALAAWAGSGWLADWGLGDQLHVARRPALLSP